MLTLVYLGVACFVLEIALSFYKYLEMFWNWSSSCDMKKLLTGFAGCMAIVSLFLTIITYVDSYSFFSYAGNKKWLFDAMVIIFFPMLTGWIGKELERDSGITNKIAASAVIITFQLMGFILFHTLGKVWVLWMIALGAISIGTMVFSVSEVKNNADVERKLRWVFAYLLFWVAIFFLFQDFSLTGFYRMGYSVLDSYVGILKYVYIALSVIFVMIITEYLGRERKAEKSMYLVKQAAYANLLLRAVLGTVNWMDLSPFPVRPPFVGVYGVIMDSVCMAILIKSGFENDELAFAEFDNELEEDDIEDEIEFDEMEEEVF